jgi:ABC-type glutathione transport system ATPase component
VEQGTAARVLDDPEHEYTKKLFADTPGLVSAAMTRLPA